MSTSTLQRSDSSNPIAEVTLTLSRVEHRASRRQRYFRAALSGVALRTVNIGTQAIALGMTVRYLKAERYGMWATLSTLVAWFSLGNVGLGHGLTSKLSAAVGRDDRESANRYINSALAIITCISLVLMAASLLLGWLVPWARVFNVHSAQAISEARPAVMVGMMITAGVLPLNLSINVLMGYQRLDVSNMISLGTTVAGLLLLFVAIAIKATLPLLVAVIFLPTLVAAIWQFWWVNNRGMMRLSWRYVNGREAWSLLSLGFQFLLVQAAGIVVFEAGALIIAQKFGAANVTPYAVTNRVTLVIMSILSVILIPLWPAYGEAFARGDIAWVRRIFFKTIGIVFLVWIPTGLALILGGRQLIGLWAGPAAVPDYPLLLAMILYTLSSGLSIVVAYPLNGIGKLSSQIVGTIAIAILHVPFALFLCGHMGEAGVAVSQSLLMFLVTIPLAYAQFFRLVRPGAAPEKMDVPAEPAMPN